MAISRGGKIFLWVAGLLVLLGVVVLLCVGLLFASFGDGEPDVRDNSVLVLKVEGALPDYVPEDPFASRFLGRDDRSLMRLLSNIKKAKNDKRVGAILLEVDMTMIGWGKADEIRDTLTDFRTSGSSSRKAANNSAAMSTTTSASTIAKLTTHKKIFLPRDIAIICLTSNENYKRPRFQINRAGRL